jgi:ribosome-associated translation inhibitor RaiA
MTSPAIVASSTSKLGELADLMIANNVSSIVITDDTLPIGIVTYADILHTIASFKVREVTYVQISGLEEDPSVYDAIYELIQKSLKKINKILPPQMLLLDVTKYKPKGKAMKYSIRAKLFTPKKIFISSSRQKILQWDLMKALDEVLHHLERQVRTDKRKAKDLARKFSKHETAGIKKYTKL